MRHRIDASAFPNWTGKIETQAYRFVDGVLELRAPPERFAGREVLAVATSRAR
ncbi:lipocalin-like domain-containing protein [Enhygromyxa salina]|uniref:lipocalin-like domain-containing protein n=1 Tax=Enhygromyxa salina TaxID=215803 RepID=UPI0011B239C9|nr:lipocalin-like domain-containing protein [Enhygromyxa salina]